MEDTEKQVDYASREVETLRKNKKEILEIKNMETEMKNSFDGLISGYDAVEERISDLQYMSIGMF